MLGHADDSATPTLRWAAEWSQRDHCHPLLIQNKDEDE
jgi:hypothetical protein